MPLACDAIFLGDNLDVLPRLDGRLVPARSTSTRRSTPASGRRAGRSRRSRRRRTATATGFGGRRYAQPAARRVVLRATRSTTTSRSSSRACARRTALLDAQRHAVLPHRLPRGALLQGAARRDLRPRLLPQRDHLGLRLRRAAPSGAGPPSTTRSSSTSRTRRATTSTARRSTASRTWRPGSSTPEKAARGKLPTDVWWHTIVADQRPREDRLPDPEAGGHRAPDGARLDRAGRLVPGLLRRQRHARGGRRAGRSPLRARRQQPGGVRRHAGAARARGQRATTVT